MLLLKFEKLTSDILKVTFSFPSLQVMGGLDDLQLLFALMRVVRSLLLNPHIQIDLYVRYFSLCLSGFLQAE